MRCLGSTSEGNSKERTGLSASQARCAEMGETRGEFSPDLTGVTMHTVIPTEVRAPPDCCVCSCGSLNAAHTHTRCVLKCFVLTNIASGVVSGPVAGVRSLCRVRYCWCRQPTVYLRQILELFACVDRFFFLLFEIFLKVQK